MWVFVVLFPQLKFEARLILPVMMTFNSSMCHLQSFSTPHFTNL